LSGINTDHRLDARPNSTWSFLLPFKAAAQKLHRVTLVTEMLKNIDVARFIANLQPKYIQRGILFHSLVSFNAATLHEFIKRSPKLDDSAVAFLFPAILEPLQKKAKYTSKDAIVGLFLQFSSQAFMILAWKLYSSLIVVTKMHSLARCSDRCYRRNDQSWTRSRGKPTGQIPCRSLRASGGTRQPVGVGSEFPCYVRFCHIGKLLLTSCYP